jgi:cytochrome P450
MTAYDIHMNPHIFPSPHTFNPDRWIESKNENYRLDKYLVPFAKGSRACVGINLAYAEMYLALAYVFKRFDFELFETTRKDVDIARDCFVATPVKGSKGIRVVVKAEHK